MKQLFLTFGAKPPALAFWSVQSHPCGKILVATTEEGAICLLMFLQSQSPNAILKHWKKAWPQTSFKQTQKQSNPLRPRALTLYLTGTAFQHRVWSALLDIPAGQTRSYSQHALAIGHKGAARAVGNALGVNPVTFLIPCHRILAANGAGGFTGGLALKKALLAMEGVHILTDF
ncbi:MAG: methylated-DNA--[protein]-cysteine S-methyltransferase [Alphaproteobacteria bacterium]|nr:methylated-DNA--[protein]-cysteine S-methyltransferase [Alphaproteobacteria bacterium]